MTQGIQAGQLVGDNASAVVRPLIRAFGHDYNRVKAWETRGRGVLSVGAELWNIFRPEGWNVAKEVLDVRYKLSVVLLTAGDEY